MRNAEWAEKITVRYSGALAGAQRNNLAPSALDTGSGNGYTLDIHCVR